MDKQQRIEIVNEIMREIASRGRRFFHSKGENGKSEAQTEVAYLFIRNNKIWYKAEWVWKHNPRYDICLSVPEYRKPKGWFHGDTLLGLVRDFKDFIQGDDNANHNNGYGGLYCSHWGYPKEDMEAIQQLAIKLGYLKP
ncbi:hypothetical protein [Pedobacter faecalis]|uniref:hypothetical protein n=1 Tax=Pedobacter faecalis TaxID=3041495 RepID=UPI00254F7C58|nr:hypothetical protein [Pedobacter sp. ELA7]